MMKFLILLIVVVVATAFLITQIIMPLFTNFRPFWIFYNNPYKEKEEKKVDVKELNDLEKEAEEATGGYRKVIEDIHGYKEKLDDIENKTKF